jgi:hypothetical protein
MHGLEQQANSLEQTGKEEWLTVRIVRSWCNQAPHPSKCIGGVRSARRHVHEWLFKLSLSTSMLQRRQW